MAWGYYNFNARICDLTLAEQERVVSVLHEGKFQRNFTEHFEEYTAHICPAPYSDECSSFMNFDWNIVTEEGKRHLLLHDNETVHEPLQAAEFLRRFLHRWRPTEVLRMNYSNVSNDGSGSPGAFYITAERIEWTTIPS